MPTFAATMKVCGKLTAQSNASFGTDYTVFQKNGSWVQVVSRGASDNAVEYKLYDLSENKSQVCITGVVSGDRLINVVNVEDIELQ